jgi:predicted membrane protein
MQNPSLVESGAKYFFTKTLEGCHNKKVKYYNTLYNLILLGFFLFIVAITLIYKYKGKLTPEEKKAKHEKERSYILNKINSIDIQKQKYRQEIITNLPTFDNYYNYL